MLEREEEPCIQYRHLYLDQDACGVLEYTEDDYLRMKSLKSKGPVVIPTGPGIDSFRAVCPWRVVSCYEAPDRRMYHLHPELVQVDSDDRAFTRLCPCCWRYVVSLNKVPPNSIASGVDFGDKRRLGLEDLRLHEQLLLSRVRMYVANVKLSSNSSGQTTLAKRHRLKGHAIMFKHDAPVVADEMLREAYDLTDKDNLRTSMQLYFVDEHGRSDILMHNMIQTSNILARPWVVYQYLQVLRYVNQSYAEIQIPDYVDFSVALGQANREIVKDTVVIDDKESVSFEAQLGSDVARAQSDERHREVPMDCEDVLETSGEELPMRTSCLFKKPELILEEEDGGEQACLGALAKLVHATDDERVREAPTNVRLGDIELEDMDNPGDGDGGFVRLNKSRREGCPVSEIDTRDTVLALAFPDVFLLGKAYGKGAGRMTYTERHHLLSQFTKAPSRNRLVLAYLFDAMQRAQVNFRVDAYVKNNPDAVEALTDLFVDPGKQEELRHAMENPHSKFAKQFMERYFRHISFAGRAVPYGAVSARGFKAKAMALCRRHGLPFGFLTFSFADPENPRSFRMSFASTNNESFPAVFGGEGDERYGENGSDFMDKLREHSSILSEGEVTGPSLSRSARGRAAITDPVAFVQESKTLFHDVCAILLGVTPEGFYDQTEGVSLRRTRYFLDSKGVLGHGQCILAVVEDHAKGTIHYHLLFFGGISSSVLQRFAGMQDICLQLSRVLDTMFVGSIPETVHTKVIVEKAVRSYHNSGLKKNEVPTVPGEPLLDRNQWKDDIDVVCIPVSTESETANGGLGGSSLPLRRCRGVRCPGCFVSAAQLQAAKQNWHEHMATCRKGVMGHTGCRLCMPCATREKTEPVLLSLESKPLQGEEKDKDGTFTYNVQDPLPAEYEPGSFLDGGVLCRRMTKEVCVWEIARPTISPSPPSEVTHLLMTIDLEGTPDLDVEPRHCREEVEQHLRDLVRAVHGLGPGTRFWEWISKCDDNQLLLVYRELMKRLPRANGYISTYNEVASYCTGSHCNFQLLGSDEQARGAIFYICPYMGKEKVPLEQCVTILGQAMKHIERYKSRAGDSGSNFRKSVHLMERCLNRMNLMMELSDYQIAAALLKLPSVISSEKFSYWTPGSSQAYRNAAGKNVPLEGASVGRMLYLTPPKSQEKFAVPHASLYPNQGWQLRHLSRYEYAALVQFGPKSKANSDDARGTRFEFAVNYPISRHYEQALNGKHCTPVILGKEPKPPGRRPDKMAGVEALESWKKAADAYADYILTIFRAEDECYEEGQQNPYKYDWEELVRWVRASQRSVSILPRFRLMAASRQVNSFCTYFDVKRMLMDYRGRSRDIWETNDHRRWHDSEQYFRSRGADNDSDYLDQLAYEAKHSEMKRSQTLSCERAASWTKSVSHQLRKVSYGTRSSCATGTIEQGSLPLLDCQADDRSFNDHIASIQAVAEVVECVNVPDVGAAGGLSTSMSREDLRRSAEALKRGSSPKEKLNEKQASVFDMYVEYLIDGGPPPPPILLVHGQGGSGKTEAVNRLDKWVKLLGKTIFKTAFNNINAVAFGGQTTASAVDLDPKKDQNSIRTPKNETLNALRKSLEVAAFIVIDEVSTQSPFHLAKLSHACQVIMDNFGKPFGGLCVVLVGDFGQLGPVKAEEFPKAVVDTVLSELPPMAEMELRPRGDRDSVRSRAIRFRPQFTKVMEARLKKEHPYYEGAMLLRQAAFVEMTEQMRAPDDQAHANLVERMYRGEGVCGGDLKELYDMLSSSDFTGNVGDWSDASIIVHSNRERLTLTHDQAVNFAVSRGTAVVRWPMQSKDWEQKPPEEYVAHAKNDPCFYQYFVVGAPAYLNGTVNKELCLVNSTSATLHSFTMEDEILQESAVSELVKARPGDVITLDSVPAYVSVCVDTSKFADNVVELYRRNFDPATDSPGETAFVLPIRRGNQLGTYTTVPLGGYDGRYLASRVSVRTPFRLETAFAITVHKSQGQTLKKVILALSKGAGLKGFSYSHLYVALSRVAERGHLRLLLTGSLPEYQWRSMSYIKELSPNRYTLALLAGFRHGTNNATPIRQSLFNCRAAIRSLEGR